MVYYYSIQLCFGILTAKVLASSVTFYAEKNIDGMDFQCTIVVDRNLNNPTEVQFSRDQSTIFQMIIFQSESHEGITSAKIEIWEIRGAIISWGMTGLHKWEIKYKQEIEIEDVGYICEINNSIEFVSKQLKIEKKPQPGNIFFPTS